jgi:hypothetical protein
VVVHHPAVLDEQNKAVESYRCRNRQVKKDEDCRGLSDPRGRRRETGDDHGDAIRSEQREGPKTASSA